MNIHSIEITTDCGCSVTRFNKEDRQLFKFCREPSKDTEILGEYRGKLNKVLEKALGRMNP